MARQEKSVDHLNTVTPISAAEQETIPHQPQTNLPLPLTPLVGREHELRAIVLKIQDPACRLFTLTGPGGVGKTRLALEVAHHLQETGFAYQVFFASLVGTNSSEFIIPAIADALGFVFSGTFALKTQLFHFFLKEKQILLVLDNLEHLLDGIELLDELIEQAPNVKLLTTSREPLNLRAEWVFEVQGLPVPARYRYGSPGSKQRRGVICPASQTDKPAFFPGPGRFTADHPRLPACGWFAVRPGTGCHLDTVNVAP